MMNPNFQGNKTSLKYQSYADISMSGMGSTTAGKLEFDFQTICNRMAVPPAKVFSRCSLRREWRPSTRP